MRLLLRILGCARAGDAEPAIDDCRRLLRFGGRLLRAGGNARVQNLGGGAIYLAVDAMARIADRGVLDSRTSRRLCAELEEYELTPELVAEMVRWEYYHWSQLIEAVAERPDLLFYDWDMSTTEACRMLLSRFLYKPQKAKSHVAASLRTAIANLEKPRSEWEKPSGPEFGALDEMERLMALSADLGCYAARLFHHRNLVVRAHRTYPALRGYQQEHGALPEKLEDLVPAFLDAVPADPYDGQPLRYSRQKRLVYSVGEDLVDDGGSSAEEDDDYTVWSRSRPGLMLRPWDSVRAPRAPP
ncbi:MAG: hypothetical protein JXA90_14270 [Planctomycetes bacterium]|nr:hypothetical protein [Planctomycetota bacterium]